MAAETRTSRAAWVEAGLLALASGGPDAVRVEALAKQLKVTKGSFYGYFADRAAFLDEVLDAWEQESTDDVLERVEHEGGTPHAKIRRAGLLTLSTNRLLPIDLAVRDWARRDPDIAERLRRVDDRRMVYLRTLFTQLRPDAEPADIEARCLLAFALLIGDHFIAASHAPWTRRQIVERAVAIMES